MMQAQNMHAISLGSSCFPASFLRDRGLRSYASIFDWLLSSPQMVCHCLRDGFESLLDAGQSQDCGQVGKAGHVIYSSMLGRATIFNHHDPRIPEHRAYLCRSATRLRLVLAKPACERKVFLICSHENRFQLENSGLEELFEELRTTTCGFQVVAVRFLQSAETTKLESPDVRQALCKESEEGTLQAFDFVLRGEHTGMHFLDSEDEKAFCQLLLPRFHGQSLACDPLKVTSDPLSSPSEIIPTSDGCSTFTQKVLDASLTFEVLLPPRESLSPRTAPIVVGTPVVLKEAVAVRIFTLLRGHGGQEIGSEPCQRYCANTWDSAAISNRTGEHDMNEVLMVLTRDVAENAELFAQAAALMGFGSGIRAALLPQAFVDCLRDQLDKQLTLSPVRGLSFKTGYDLFRLEDLEKVVAGGMSVRKAPAISEPFVVVAARS